MGRREIELRDILADAMGAARITGGQVRQLMPVYGDRLGLAYQVIRGQQIRQMGRAIAVTAIVATISGAVAAMVAERLIAHRQVSEEAAESEEPVKSDAAFTG